MALPFYSLFITAPKVLGCLCHSKDDTDEPVNLGARRKGDDRFYHACYCGVKDFLKQATSRTIEEMQSFANLRTPSLPSARVTRTLVPFSCCDEAATNLIKALGGEDVARRVVGGVKWWQVRAGNGVDAEWITMKKDWQEAKKSHKMKQAPMGVDSPFSSPSEGYDKSMDAMRCILYLHGGGYYFGSVSQTRYSSERFARKISGRVFAINYRLAPQYPFPCGLHDALAAYLFLIRPPPGADHTAINPAHIIVSGDSAGGGLALALLQVIRDTGLPLPAGGVLISPWCDLTHSFPSIDENTKKDYIPECGLSFHKPSTLWPPPSPSFTKFFHASLRRQINQTIQKHGSASFNQATTVISEPDVPCCSPSHSEDTNSRLVVRMDDKDIEIKDQLQFYTVNTLLNHPLVSPVTGYLGGLPPLLFTAGDEEVLRDEIIYTAHKAAYPDRYPVLPSSRLLYPYLQDIEKRHKPTSVHLQVYDATHHILPVIFTFTKPAKFCFRAIANFNKFVTDMESPTPTTTVNHSSMSLVSPNERSPFRELPVSQPPQESREDLPEEKSERTAGGPQVYEDINDRSNWECRMIRERVSTLGVIRDLEPENELGACKMPLDRVARLSDDMLRRYVKNKRTFDERFGHKIEAIQKSRHHHLTEAEKEDIQRVDALSRLIGNKAGVGSQSRLDFYQRALTSPGCSWSWILDEREDPPPSSIAGRRDTKEARQLAAVVGDHALGGILRKVMRVSD